MAKNLSAPNWFLIAAFFIAGTFLGGLVLFLWLNINTPVLDYKVHLIKKYKFINPLLAVEISNRNFAINRALELNLTSYIKQKQNEKTINYASIYFRDIEGGNFIGINENDKFSPGKLLRIPIMIAYFQLAEQNPDILSQELTYVGPDNNQGSISKPKIPLVKGQSYNIEDLINKMILDDDNNAANLLFDFIDKNLLNEIFLDLGINFKEDKNVTDFIGNKTYSFFFRVLYNATYLNKEYSERALEILSGVDAERIGFATLIPKNVPVVQSYRTIILNQNEPNIIEIQNCGIIYYPQHPYILCTVTRGQEVNQIGNVLDNINKIIYDDMNFRYRVSVN